MRAELDNEEVMPEDNLASAKIFVNVHRSFEVESVAYWFERWQGNVSILREREWPRTKIWYVEAPVEALRELPESVIARPGIQE